jgi:RNA polymerase sigma-70 factor (ECF subfamily)
VHRARQREVVEALLAASRGGNFDALLALLDPDVVVRADATAVSFGAKPEVRGANSVLETFLGRARAAQPALLDGLAGIVWAPSGQVRVAFSFTVDEAGKIVEIHLAADPDHIGRLNLEILGPAAE